MRFSYKQFEVQLSSATQRKRIVKRPIIPIILKNRDVVVGYEALIDSGADYNLFDKEIADLLGIQLTRGNKRQIVGIGGEKLNGYEHRLDIRAAGEWYKGKVIFSQSVPENSVGILGNQGFFDHFRVSLRYSTGDIELIPNRQKNGFR